MTIISVLAAAVILLTATATLAESVGHNKTKVIAYVPNWIDTATFEKTIDYSKITHINIAFENPTNPSGDLSFSRENNILINKAHLHRIPVLISIGGGAASGDKTLLARYADLLSVAKRVGFAAKIADYLTKHNFDGLDVDIEGPSITNDYGAFIPELSRALKPKGKLLTAALSQGYGGDKVPASVFAHIDFVNIMAYDGAGFWNPKEPGQHSSLEFAKSNVEYWLKRGLPKSKAVLGIPFYGYGFGQAFRKSVYPYSEKVAGYTSAENSDKIGSTIWYNGLHTVRAKAEFIKKQNLAGAMIWSLDNDVRGKKSLLSALSKVLEP